MEPLHVRNWGEIIKAGLGGREKARSEDHLLLVQDLGSVPRTYIRQLTKLQTLTTVSRDLCPFLPSMGTGTQVHIDPRTYTY